VSDEAKAPRFRTEMEDDAGNIIHPDWSLIASNQFTEITQNSAIIDNQKQMIAKLTEIVTLWDEITKRQGTMVEAIRLLADQMDKGRMEVKTMLSSIIQVPIAVVVIAGSSWLFYLKYIEEYTWIVILAVASFRYLGDSISGVVKLIGLRRGNGEQK
jgi:hypothetical protein